MSEPAFWKGKPCQVARKILDVLWTPTKHMCGPSGCIASCRWHLVSCHVTPVRKPPTTNSSTQLPHVRGQPGVLQGLNLAGYMLRQGPHTCSAKGIGGEERRPLAWKLLLNRDDGSISSPVLVAGLRDVACKQQLGTCRWVLPCPCCGPVRQPGKCRLGLHCSLTHRRCLSQKCGCCTISNGARQCSSLHMQAADASLAASGPSAAAQLMQPAPCRQAGITPDASSKLKHKVPD